MVNLLMFLTKVCLHVFIWSVVTGIGLLVVTIIRGITGWYWCPLDKACDWFECEGAWLVFNLAVTSLLAAFAMVFVAACLEVG